MRHHVTVGDQEAFPIRLDNLDAPLGQPILDLVFINAGYVPFEVFDTVSEDTFRRTFDTNVFGSFFAAQELAPLVKEGGSIIFTTSVAFRRGFPDMSVYAASKAAVQSLVQSLAAELVSKKIRINAVNPGYIKASIGVNDFPSNQLVQVEAAGAKQTPMGRTGEQKKVAKAVAFLAYEATFTTGSEFVLDGGLTSLVKKD